MSLFTDGSICGIPDLTAYDSAVLDVAGTEGIDLTSKLTLAQDEIGVELPMIWTAPEGVVVTAPLRLWHAFQTLALVYADAYHRQLNDRYRGKRDEYREMARWAAEKLFEIGVGITADPTPKAEPPELTLAAGQQAEGTYYATVAWVNRRGEEGAPAATTSLEVPGGSVLAVRAVNPPANAAGWNVYAGVSPETLYMQNESLLAVGSSWSPGGELGTSGRRPGTGQEPEYLRAVPRVLRRG